MSAREAVRIGTATRTAHASASRSPAWQRVAAGAVLMATATAAPAAAFGASVWHVLGAAACIAIAILALSSPNAITAHLVGGLLLTGSVLIGDDRPAAFVMLLMVMGTVAAAELLAVAARLATPIERDTRDDLRKAAIAVAMAGAVFGVVLMMGRVPGPTDLRTGLPAIAIASGACVLLAIVLVSTRFGPREQPPAGTRLRQPAP